MAEVWKVEGKSFIITGGASGLGAEYVEAFLKEGAKNIAILDVAEETGIALSKKLNKVYNNRTTFVTCDISKEDDIETAFEEVLDKFKQIDVIINNAGIMNDADHIWRKSCDVNYQGVVSFTRKGVHHMRKDEGGAGGTIVNVSSIAGFLKLPIIPSYSGAKAAVLHFSLSLSDPPFFDKTGVRVLTVCFGPTRTPLMENLPEKSVDKETATKIVEQFSTASYQPVENAVAAMIKMFKIGTNGSVWVASRGRDAEDITSVINDTHKMFENIVFNGLDAAKKTKTYDVMAEE